MPVGGVVLQGAGVLEPAVLSQAVAAGGVGEDVAGGVHLAQLLALEGGGNAEHAEDVLLCKVLAMYSWITYVKK